MANVLGFRSSKINTRIVVRAHLAENDSMVRIVQAVILTFISVTTWAQPANDRPPPLGEEASLEYQVKKEMIEDRVADFYTRLILLEREDRKRMQAAEEHRKERQRQAAEYERARRQYVKKRTVDPPRDPSRWQKELAERHERYERNRRDYVRRREKLEKFQESVGGIPEEVEFGLEEVYR